MRVLFDVSALFRDRRVESGVPTYTLSLIKIFQKLSSQTEERLPRRSDQIGTPRNDKLEVMFFYSGRKTFGVEHYINEYIHLPIPNKIIQLLTFLGVKFDWLIGKFARQRHCEEASDEAISGLRAIQRDCFARPRNDNSFSFDVYFTPNVSTFYRYFSKKIKVVGVVHDLSHILFPELKPFEERWKYSGQSKTHIIERLAFWNRSRKPIFARFHQLIAISQHTKNDLVEFLKIPEEKIVVIYPTLQSYRHPRITFEVDSEFNSAPLAESKQESRNENKQKQTVIANERERSVAISLGAQDEIASSQSLPRNDNSVSFSFLDSGSKPGMTQGILERFGIRKSYLLFLGHIEPRKNVENLLRAFSLLKQARTHAEKHADSRGRLEKLQLVVAGRQGYQFSRLLDLAYKQGLTYRNYFLEDNMLSRISNFKFQISNHEQSPYSSYYGDRINNSTSTIPNEFQASNSTHYPLPTTHYFDIIFTGSVSEEEKYMLMQNAAVFVYPSLYEGFAYPCLEAMSVGTPVVTSPVSALSEVLGDAVLYANPWRPESIATVVQELLQDQNFRNGLIEKGKKQVGKYQNSEVQSSQWRELFKKI